MVFRNGAPVTQVATRDQLAAGRFYWDSVNNKLYLGTDPAGAVIEIASRAWAVHLHAGAAGSMVRGLGFVHWATSQDYRKRPAAVIVQAPDVVLESNTVAHNAAAGTLINAHGVRVSGNLYVGNGFNGVNTHKSNALVFEANHVYGNNVERFGLNSGSSLAGAGVKAAYLHDAVVRDRLFTRLASERDSAVANYGYTSEGIGFHAATASAPGLIPVHRLQRGSLHHYAAGDAERDTAVAEGWRYESVVWYARPAG